jgi:hypothetical protein
MKIIELLESLRVQYQTEGHKHCKPGWINMGCPFCTGNPGLHLGFNLQDEYFKCWRCGWHPILETVSKLSGIPPSQVRDLIKGYGGKTRRASSKTIKVQMHAFKFPTQTVELTDRMKAYLKGRRFNPETLVDIWGLKGTLVGSVLDKADYAHRIIAPIYWNDRIVSFQGRALSNKNPLKYKACPKNREVIHHKHILYGLQEHWGEVGICVEGITDVWRFGPKSFATFGIEYKLQQVKQMVKAFKHIAVVFDGGEIQAQKQAERLVADLRVRGVHAWRESIVGDPGGMDQDAADDLVKKICG